MRNKLYLKTLAVIMAITAPPVFSLTAQAQRQVQVVEIQKQPDGTEIHVPKTIEVPEKSAEEVAAAKRKAATVTAEEDDLQYFLNNLAKTRAGESTVVIDLSTFKDTIRQTTLQVNQGISLKFTNGAIRRGEGIAKDEPVVMISNGTAVEFDETVILSGENLENNGPVVHVDNSSLKTAAYIGNTKIGSTLWHYYSLRVDTNAHIESHSAGSKSMTLYANSTTGNSTLEIIGGVIAPGLSYGSDNNMVMTGGKIGESGQGGIHLNGKGGIILSGGKVNTVYCDNADAAQDVFVLGENVSVRGILYANLSSKLRLSQMLTNNFYKTLFLQYHNPEIHDGLVVAVGENGYQISQEDLSLMALWYWHTGGDVLQDISLYKLCLEGNSVVVRKKVQDLQSAINNAADNTETTINLDNYGELTTGILIPTGKKIKMTGTKNVALASNFTGDYIFRTEGDAQLDITIPGFSTSTYPKYAFVAGGGSSKIQINQYGESIMAYLNTLLYTENGGTIDCYSKITKTTFYNSTGGTINIYSDGDVLNPTAEEGSTTNITGKLFFSGTFTAEGTVRMRGDIISNLTNLVLGKNSLMTFTTDVARANAKNLIASFKNNDYTLGKDYIHFLGSYYRIKFSELLYGHTPTIGSYIGEDEKKHDCIRIVEYDKEKTDAELARIAVELNALEENRVDCVERLQETRIAIEENYNVGNLTSEEYEQLERGYRDILPRIAQYDAVYAIYKADHLSIIEAGYYAEIWIINAVIDDLQNRLFAIEEEIASLQRELDTILASHKKPFTNTDDLQDYLNSLAQNNETTPDAPAKVSVENGTEIEDIVIPEGTHVEIDIDGNGGESTDDLQAYLNGLVNVSEGSSLTIKGKWVVPTGALNPRIDVRGIIDIYATIILEGTREEVVRVYGGGTANWRGNMPTGKIHNEGTLNHYSGTTGHIENHGTANHSGGTCHHIVNYVTYNLTGGTIDGNGSTFDYAFENHGTAHLTGGTIIHRHTLIYIVKGATTYIDGTKLDDSNAMTTIRAYEDFHMRGDYKPVNIELYYGVRIHFLTSWTVRWHITFIDNRVTVRKVIFMSDDFTFDDRNIQYIDYPLPDGYRWYWNREENGIELRDDRVYDSDDLQNFLDGLASNPGTSLEPRRLYGDGHTVYINRRFSFPALTHVLIRDIRLIFDGSDGRWDIPSGTTVYLCDTKVENDGEGVSGLHVHGDLYLEKTIFLNVHLYLYRTLYIWDRITSPLYIHYIADGGLNGGERIAEGADGYILTESDLQNLIYSDEPTDGHDWYLMLDGNAIVLADRNITGIGGIHGVDTATPRAAFTPDGTLRISGTSPDTPCMLFRTDGTRIATGTAAEIATKAMGIAKGHYILRIGSETLKLVR